MKRITAILLCLCACFGWGAQASESIFTDMEPTGYVYEAAALLHTLGLIQGYEDQTFRPDYTITRAEMAAVAVRLLSMEDAAKAVAGMEAVFSDVPVSHWANGYIAVAKSQGIIAGHGDGTFDPDGDVTYEQAVKILVSALGLDLYFRDAPNAYPTLYLEQAVKSGITLHTEGTIGQPATRGTVAVLTYNALFAEI